MLVLSRSRNEKILIGDSIEVTVVDVRGDKVRLGITAPEEVPVHREEVYIAIQQEQRLKEIQESEGDRKWREWAERKGKPC